MHSILKKRPHIPPEMKSIISEVRRDLIILAAVGALDVFVICVLLWGWEEFSIGLGVVLALIFFLAAADRGRVLTKKPRSLHLVKARTWAYVLHAALPIGPFIARRLLTRLHRPELVSYAVAEDPAFGGLPTEEILVLTRLRSSFLSLRSIGWVLIIMAILAAIAIPGLSDIQMRKHALNGIIPVMVLGFTYVLMGIICRWLLRRPTRKRLAAVRIISLVLLFFPPFGTWAGGQALFLVNSRLADRVCKIDIS